MFTYTIKLLTSLLRNNPFMGKLDPDPFRMKLQELSSSILDHLPDNLNEARYLAIQGGGQHSLTEINESILAAAISEVETLLAEPTIELTAEQQEYNTKVQTLKFTQSALEFIDLFDSSTVALEDMLLSANTSDVSEALRFFVQARHFDLPCAVTGMKRALSLMWSTEQSIQNEVLKAFVEVFIAVPGSEGNQLLPAKDIAMNLVKLVKQASVSEAASIEEAIVRLVKDERLSVSVFKSLWSISSTNPFFRAAVIQIISMGASASRTIIDCNSRLKTLLDDGLCSFAGTTNDWELAGNVAICLQRLNRATTNETDAKFIVLEHIVDALCKIVSGDACTGSTDDTLRWFSASEQAIKALFVICPEPEIVCNCVILNMAKATFSNHVEVDYAPRLARFFHVLGCVAINLLVYSESLISCVRRASSKKSLRRQEESDKSKRQKKTSEATKLATIDGEDEIEVELGVAAAAEAENEQKLVDISENEILGRGLVSQFIPLLIRFTSPENHCNCKPILAQSSMLALCKFMCVSSSFCEKYLALIFTGLANSDLDDVTLRANTVVALGDVAFRFPNQFEPYTSRLYACLRDSSVKVRRHTLMVLTHLILNDMIKVKGQVSEIAMCLKDSDQRVRDMSRLLFHELSKRSNNPIYNLLPDIISQLSQKSIRNEDFRNIMSILLSYITKERQFELLTEKLCQRFPTCTTVSQKADIAHCLSQIRMTDKCIKCLVDNFKAYKDSLFDEDVVKSFLLIVSKAKKFVKPEMKDFVEEWEAKLHASSTLGVENLVVTENATQASKKTCRKKKREQMDMVMELSPDNECDKENCPNIEIVSKGDKF
jgi:condensin complex subunit 1